MTRDCILALNGGSATLKYAVYGPIRATSAGECLARGQVDLAPGSRADSVRRAMRDLAGRVDAYEIAAIGHRIVHGGVRFVAPVVIDDAVVAELEALQPLAPLHQALGLAVIGAAREQRPQLPQVAAFDTAFHASMPMVSRRFALPQAWFDRGVRRFGFHGLSYEFIASKLVQMRGSEPTQRVVVAHLGSGASLCAMRDGLSVATTMSFTPTDGLMMATRSGAVDPGAVLYLLREHRMNVEAVEHLLNLESGLLGVSGGVSGDIRVLLESRDPAAQLAVDLFVHRVVVETGAMVAALGGVDAIVFTGGIGTHQPRIRSRIGAALAWLGVDYDGALNEDGQMRFDSKRSAVALWNIPTDEEAVIAGHAARLYMDATMRDAMDEAEVAAIDAYWRAANYLSVGQIYLLDNPLLTQPLVIEHVKPRLLGHWGTTPGLNFVYAHLNRAIKQRDLSMILITGPGHGGPAIVANAYLEGTYSEVYPSITRDAAGMKKLFKQFSFPGGIPSHVAAETPGSIHEGGELGYALSHAYGAALDNPGLIVACVIGDGEAETGPLAASWHSNKFLNPRSDGAVLPILHLNGYKIANPTLLARMGHEELDQLLRGYGHLPYYVEGDDPAAMHRKMAVTLSEALDEVRRIQHGARNDGATQRPRWPVIVLRSPKGWTGPAEVDGKKTEGHWRSHQVPLSNLQDNPAHLAQLEQWLKSYRPHELFDEHGTLRVALSLLAPKGERRLGANPHANGGLLLRDLQLPDIRDHAVPITQPGVTIAESTRVLGEYLRDVLNLNAEARNFRIVGPDETASNRLSAVFDVTSRVWMEEILPTDTDLAAYGRVMEILSEHTCEGWLEGYLLTGRHGLFSCYEAFIHIVDSMFNQHAKWLKVSAAIAWRRPIASLNYLLTSHVWRQDHNGFSHQDPGFIDHVANKKASVVSVYLPPDANSLLWVMDHCLRSRNRINVVVAGKHPEPQWLTMDQARKQCPAGIGIWEWASNDAGGEPDVVMACAGDVPTLETLAAVQLLWANVPQMKIRVVNVIDLMTLQPSEEHPHGLSNHDFDRLFTTDSPIIFAYHGYPWLIHRLAYRRTNHDNLHVRGYKEEGTTTTPFDMAVRNQIDRFNLMFDAVDRVPRFSHLAPHIKQFVRDKLIDHREYIERVGDDMPELRNWTWSGVRPGS